MRTFSKTISPRSAPSAKAPVRLHEPRLPFYYLKGFGCLEKGKGPMACPNPSQKLLCWPGFRPIRWTIRVRDQLSLERFSSCNSLNLIVSHFSSVELTPHAQNTL